MKKSVLLLIPFLALFLIMPGVLQAREYHWAQGEIDRLAVRYGIYLEDEPDQRAEAGLQEELFLLAALPLAPEEKMIRYTLLSSMVEQLGVQLGKFANNDELDALLNGYIDLCRY